MFSKGARALSACVGSAANLASSLGNPFGHANLFASTQPLLDGARAMHMFGGNHRDSDLAAATMPSSPLKDTGHGHSAHSMYSSTDHSYSTRPHGDGISYQKDDSKHISGVSGEATSPTDGAEHN